jgi:hypothetical protein
MVKVISIALACLAASIVASGQISCTQEAYSYSQQDVCDCTNKPDYPGGCRNQLNIGVSCTIESFYSCGKNGDQNCQIAFTETTGPTCNGDGDIARKEVVAFDSVSKSFAKWLASQFEENSLHQKANCAESNEAFEAWLAREMKAVQTSSGE